MPQSSHDPTAEHHNFASHAHAVAAVALGKADHLNAHELSNLDHELSREDLKRSERHDTATAEPAIVKTGTGDNVKAEHVIRPGLPL